MSAGGGIAVASAPMRISLAGGGTDLPSYAERFGGTVLNLAIDRRTLVAVSEAADRDLFGSLGAGIRIDHDQLMGGDFLGAAVDRVGARPTRVACVTTARPPGPACPAAAGSDGRGRGGG
jgi:hypothetical protein